MEKQSKLAKCGLHKYSFCTHKHDAEKCKDCILVHHRPKKRIIKDNITYVYCPHCGEYKPTNEFRPNKQGYLCWCIDCMHNYHKEHYRTNNKSFMIGFKNKNGIRKFIKIDSSAKMIKFVKEHMIINNESTLEIKRL